jgi:hypothetical protein
VAADEQEDRPVEVRGYRTPRYPVFLLTGAVLGLLTGLALATFGAAPTATGGLGVLGYFAALGTFLGALLAGTLAVVVESLLNRGRRGRARRPRA